MVLDFARGGGGGSGGSSGGGGGIAFIGLVGFVPANWLGSKFRVREKAVLGSAVMWPMAIVALLGFGYALGLYGVLIGMGALLGTGSGLYGWFSKLIKMNKKAKKDLELAASTDPAWDEATILARTSEIFAKYQADWTAGNVEAIKAYTTPTYQYHVSLMLYALGLAGRYNSVDEIQITHRP